MTDMAAIGAGAACWRDAPHCGADGKPFAQAVRSP